MRDQFTKCSSSVMCKKEKIKRICSDFIQVFENKKKYEESKFTACKESSVFVQILDFVNKFDISEDAQNSYSYICSKMDISLHCKVMDRCSLDFQEIFLYSRTSTASGLVCVDVSTSLSAGPTMNISQKPFDVSSPKP